MKDLVIQGLTNGAEIKAKAEKGDALSCFQMGMMHLLGIDTPIDFKKAGKYLGNQSLVDDPDANRLLGFIAECEGNYSLAFKNYANATGTNGSNAKKPYINKVFTERNNLQAYLKKFELPSTVLNKQITAVLNEFVKGGNTKVDSSIKLAMICDDEESCLEAAQALFDEGDYYSAMRWLQDGNVSDSNTLYASVKKKLSDSKNVLNLPNVLEVIEIEGSSFLANFDSTPSYAGVKELCDEETTSCKKEWHDKVSPKISTIKKKVEDEEAARIKKEKEEAAARLKKQKEEEAARLRKQKEAEQRALLVEQEIRRNKIYRRYNIIYGIINAPTVFFIIAFLFTEKTMSFISKFIVCAIVFAILVYLPYIIIKWIIKKICKL
jgi:hypothetical protein